MTTTVPSVDSVATGRPLERAQAVWQAAVELAVGTAGDGPGAELVLLRAAGFDPSTLHHALTLGRTRLRHRPRDATLRRGAQLLERATDWLGARGSDGEVGTARSDRTRALPGAAPEASRPHGAHSMPPA